MNTATHHRNEALRNGSSPCETCGVEACGFQSFPVPPGAARVITLERGQSLECRETACLKFWSIQSGHAATSLMFSDGRRQILSVERKGDTLCGLMASPESEQKLEALSECRICELDLSPWAADLMKDAGFLAMTMRLMHRRMEKSMAHAAALGRLDSQERITYFLAEMAAQQGHGNPLVTLPMSREDIADYLGLNADSVSRVLSRIRKTGLFRFISPTEYTVPDFKAVARRLPVALPEFAPPIPANGGSAP